MKKRNFKKTIISLLVAIIVFIGLLIIESSILTPNGTAQVFVATDEIQKGVEINDSNIDTYFKPKNVDGELAVTNYISNKEDLLNLIANETINKGEVISANSFVDKDDVLSKIENPVEVSFKATDISQTVGGILRQGDMIDISIINSTTNEVEKVLSDVYVTKAMSSDGQELTREQELSAMVINIIISSKDEEKLNSKLNLGTIRVSKVQ